MVIMTKMIDDDDSPTDSLTPHYAEVRKNDNDTDDCSRNQPVIVHYTVCTVHSAERTVNTS